MVGTNDKGPTKPRRIQFPIAEDFTTYEARKAGQVEGMRDDAKRAIDAARPYKGGNDALWRIHSLNNADKHRNLLTVGHEYLFFADWLPWRPDYPYWHRTTRVDFTGVFEDNAEKNLEAEIDKAVDKSQVGNVNALLPALHQLVDFTDGFIATFEALLK